MKPFLRVVGSNSSPGIAFSWLNKWLNLQVLVCPSPYGMQVGRSTETRQNLFQEYPVFGSRYSSLYKHIADEHERLPPAAQDLAWQKGDGDTDFAVFSSRSLQVEHALEIFSTFMTALAPLIHWKGHGETSEIIKSLVEELMVLAPALFPDEKAAKIMLIPAILEHLHPHGE